jgi:hypothetical protein
MGCGGAAAFALRATHAVVIVGLTALAAGCSSGPVSYVVLTLQSATPTPITGVTDVEVQVMKGTTQMKTLTYHHDPFTIDMATPSTTLSVSFTSNEVGNVTFNVNARASSCLVGMGVSAAAIQRGGRADATVVLEMVNGCPQPADGGAPDAFPGCDPVTPACGPGMTCQVDCSKKLGECTAGGTRGPGSACSANSDCMPGTQCFDYTTIGCGVKVCLRFCNTVAECAQPAPDAGVSPGSLCMGPVACGGVLTAYHTCTFGCDPRLSAASAGTTGCPAGLACLVIGKGDQVDCACAESTRTKTEGQSCTRAVDCVPGLVCDIMTGGAGTCRPICHCKAQGTTCTATENDCPTANTHCVPLTDDVLYGACIP